MESPNKFPTTSSRRAFLKRSGALSVLAVSGVNFPEAALAGADPSSKNPAPSAILQYDMLDLQLALAGPWSTKHFFIEYKEYFSNHLSHGVIALSKLGANDARIYQFVGRYIVDLRQPEQPATAATPRLMRFGEAKYLLGRGQDYYRLVDFYQSEVHRYGTEDTVRKYLPKLWDGICGAAFHPIIHLGYGLAAGPVDRLVVEGLAYLHYAYTPLGKPAQKLKTGAGEVDYQTYADAFLAMLLRARAEGKLRASTGSTRFTRRMQSVADDNGVMLNTYTETLPNCCDMGWLLDLAIQLFSATAKEGTVDFFLLHGVTSTWALTQITPLFDETAPIIKCHEKALLTTYIAQGCPALADGPGFVDTLPESETTWEAIVAQTLERENAEHLYKLVQVCKSRSACTDARLPESHYREAALKCLKYQYRRS